MDVSWVNWESAEKLTIDDAKFIFEQAEKLLKDITETNVLIVSRTTTLITITVGFMLALVGFMFNRFSQVGSVFDTQLTACFLSFLYVFSLCRILVMNIQGQDYSIVGAEPKLLFVDNFFKDDIKDDQRILRFYVNEIVVCQSKIDANKATNEKRLIVVIAVAIRINVFFISLLACF